MACAGNPRLADLGAAVEQALMMESSDLSRLQAINTLYANMDKEDPDGC